MEFINMDGAQHCKVCNSTFKVYDLDESPINFCPFCSARSENLEPVEEYDDDKNR